MNTFFKKILLATCVLLFISNQINAQQCGTQLLEEQLSYMNDTRIARDNTNISLLSNNDERTNFQIAAHIVRDVNGTEGLSNEDLQTAIDDLNTAFEPVNFKFNICNINYIDNDTYFEKIEYPGNNEVEMANANLVPNLINIFFAPNIYFYGSSACGWAYYPSSTKDWILMSNNCSINGSTLAHEMGHYFNLYHTFEAYQGYELVNRTTGCGPNLGDELCDTPADPQGIDTGQGKIYALWKCTDSSTCEADDSNVEEGCGYTDINGDLYTPDRKNLMSYNYKRCRTNFSPQQIDRIKRSYLYDRNYLNNYCEVDCDNMFTIYDWLEELTCQNNASTDITIYKYNEVFNYLELKNGSERNVYLSSGDLICPGLSIEACITQPELGEILATCNLPCQQIITGCTDAIACNYNANATIDDGSCYYSCKTCDSAIEIYPWLSEFIPANTCVEIVDYFDGIFLHFVYVKFNNQGAIYLNYNGTGVNYGSDNGDRSIAKQRGLDIISAEWVCGCNEEIIYGCTDPSANNFNPLANVDDGSCNYNTCDLATDAHPWLSEFVSANTCTEVTDYLDGVWHYIYVKSGDQGTLYLNSNGQGIYYGSDNGDGRLVNSYNLSIIENQWICNCGESTPIYGCTDSSACNFNPQATIDDGSCNYNCSTCDLATDAYPWLNEFIPVNNCTEITDYLDGVWHYIYVKSGEQGTLYLNIDGQGRNYGSDNGDARVVNSYNLSVIENQWSCNCSQSNSKTLTNNIGLKTLADNEFFKLYPNPSSGKVMIELNSDSKDTNAITVFNLSGKIVHQGQLEGRRTILDLSKLVKGVYMVKIENDQNIHNNQNIQKLLIE